MKAAIFDPYLDTLGGGERYVMSVAQILRKHGWEVDVGWSEVGIIKKLEVRLGLDLSGVNVVKDIHRGQGYDLVFWLSDGSIPTLFAAKNILHFQVPFHDVGGRSPFNQLKLRRINTVVCNSNFTKRFIDKEYGVNSVVIYPPVDVEKFVPAKKENIILGVARFSQLLQAKRQDILIDVFKKMVDKELSGWKLILAGGSDVGGQEYLVQLRKQINDYPIKIIENPDFNQLKTLYGKTKIFWSASGFGIDEKKKPEKVEHFGIAVVEAMAAGCVPVVVAKGGHKEIMDKFLWNTEEELILITRKLINDTKLWNKVSIKAKLETQKYSYQRFEEEILKPL